MKKQGRRINNLRFADDVDLMEENREKLNTTDGGWRESGPRNKYQQNENNGERRESHGRGAVAGKG